MVPRTPRTGHLAAGLALACVVLAASVAHADAPPQGPFLYEDARGSTHMVQRLEDVPRKFRTRMRTLAGDKVEYQERVTTVTPERAARARARARALAAVPERRRESVIFYTASWCSYCKQTRAYLQQKGIAYEERDIDDPRYKRELRAKTGNTMVPVVQYEDRIILGYNPRAIDALGL